MLWTPPAARVPIIRPVFFSNGRIKSIPIVSLFISIMSVMTPKTTVWEYKTGFVKPM